MCTPESKEECTTTYEEKCTVTYAHGKQCEKIPHKHCKYVQVNTNKKETKAPNLSNIFFLRFQDVKNHLTRSARKALRISARKLPRRLGRR